MISSKKDRICIIIEGGGKKNKNLIQRAKLAFQAIFDKLFPTLSIEIRMCGGRGEVIDDFNCAKKSKKYKTVFALIDSEEILSEPLSQLKDRKNFLKKGLFKKRELQDDDATKFFFMVVNTESWLLTDKENLKKFFGQGFKPDKLPQNPTYENISKTDIERGFKNAIRDCPKKEMKKPFVFDLLKTIDIQCLQRHGNEIRFFIKSVRAS